MTPPAQRTLRLLLTLLCWLVAAFVATSAAEPTASAVPASTTVAYTYDVPSNTSQARFVSGRASDLVRASSSAIPARSAGDLSAPRALLVAADTTASEAAALLGKPGDIVVLGRLPDTALWKGVEGHVVLDTPTWSPELNDAFIRGAIDQRRTIYLASPTKGNLIQTEGAYAGQPTIYARELDMLRQAGYTPSGSYLLPPP